MISNEHELAEAVGAASTHLQEINDYLADHPQAVGRVRFPRGYLSTVNTYAARYPWMNNRVLRRNLAYQYVFGDILRWINNRTDVWGLAKEMVIKHAIVVMGSIAESLLATSVQQLGYPEARFPSRLNRLFNEQIVDGNLRDELRWLWDSRNAIHLHEVPNVEIEVYEAADARRAYKAVQGLETALANHFEQLEVPF